MGNRALVKLNKSDNVAVYLHWNGGIGSVRAFLKYCELRGFRVDNGGYGVARFAQIVGNFFGGGLSVGIQPCMAHTEEEYNEESWGLDNGIYVCENWEIVERYPKDTFSLGESSEYELEEMLIAIDKAQPVKEQLGDYLKGVPCKVEDIQLGDRVAYINWNGEVEYATIEEFGNDRTCNGTNVKGLPYTGKYDRSNINSYLLKNTDGLVKITA